MRFLPTYFRFALCACLLLAVASSDAAETAKSPTFLRIVRDDKKEPISLETAIVRYAAPGDEEDKPYVDLIGAVHIGERAYYDSLNKVFRDYDAVLYELVAPEGANVPTPGQRSGHPVSVLQMTMKNMLDLEFQLDRINYGKTNFVHADLTPDEFTKSMQERDESFSKLFFRLMGQGLAQQSKDPARKNDIAVFSALFSRDRSVELKRTMAVQFEEMEKATSVLEGPKGSTIIGARNNRAIEVMNGQFKAGKRKIAIFYGAAHLPDFDRKLRADLGFLPMETRWLVAWDLKDKDSKKK